MRNGRCRLHGGESTGPRTPAGLERSRRARWRHGGRGREFAALRREGARRRRRIAVLCAEAEARIALEARRARKPRHRAASAVDPMVAGLGRGADPGRGKRGGACRAPAGES